MVDYGVVLVLTLGAIAIIILIMMPFVVFGDNGLHIQPAPNITTTYHQQPPFKCPDTVTDPILLVTYSDANNNSIDIWCVVSHSLDNSQYHLVQFVAVYNRFIVVGQCPFVLGTNTFSIETNEEGLINATHWTSTPVILPSGEVSIEMNVNFNR